MANRFEWWLYKSIKGAREFCIVPWLIFIELFMTATMCVITWFTDGPDAARMVWFDESEVLRGLVRKLFRCS